MFMKCLESFKLMVVLVFAVFGLTHCASASEDAGGDFAYGTECSSSSECADSLECVALDALSGSRCTNAC